MSLERVRWGIIGVGDVTERKSGPGFSQAERSELVAVMRRDGAKAEDYARRHGVKRAYDDADALIADPEVDAVYIATPPDAHADYTLRVAAAGKPVYVEKPMARTAAECRTMIDACDAAGVSLSVAYYRRAMPRFATVRSLVESGRLGTPRSLVVRSQRPAEPVGTETPWRLRPEISGGGLFVDLGSHVLDLLDWMFGPLTAVHGTAVNRGGLYGAEDLVTATFTCASGIEGVGLWDYDAQDHRDEIEVVGSAGSLMFSAFGQEPLRITDARGIELVEAPYPATVQAPLIQAVVDSLTGRGTSPSTGRSALRTAEVIDTVLAGFRRDSGPSSG